MWLPTNDDTKTILYDTKFLKSSPGRYPALKWSVTKIEDTATEGISKFTLAQTQFDPMRDNAELGIADYWESAVEPEILESEEIITDSDLEITYSGYPAVRAGGGYKKFTLKERMDNELVDVEGDIEWNIYFDGNEDKLSCISNGNTFKVKCSNDYSLIGKIFTIVAESAYDSQTLIVEVTSL
jgi:hypothetical protein